MIFYRELEYQNYTEQTRELTHDFFRLSLMLSGLGNFVVDCHI